MRLSLLVWAVSVIAQSQDIVPVTGLRTGWDEATQRWPARRNILDLAASGPQWDLYIQGLIALQAVPEDDELSYFQLSGIHGRPFIPFNGVEQAPDAPLIGYCTHSQVLFGMWHRPMVALFEQAADQWRQPYWDRALDGDLPTLFRQQNVTVTSTNGKVTVPNPLLLYKFQQYPLNATLFPSTTLDGLLNTYPETVRCPGFNNSASNQYQASDGVGAYNLHLQLYNIYTHCRTFECMSTIGTSGASIEFIHNEVHTAVGGQHPLGHMADLAYSGFDPVFMVHHSAIDRHVALWQAIHYNVSGFATYLDIDGEFATPQGTNVSVDYPLLPFYKDEEETFWTSRSAWDVSGFGYSYPELEGDCVSLEDRARNVTAAVNALYGGLHNRTNDSPCHRRWIKSGLTPYYEYFVEISVDKSEVQLPAEIVLSVNGTAAGRFSLMSTPVRGLVHADLALETPKDLEATDWSDMSSLTPLLRMINVEVSDNNQASLLLTSIPSLQVSLRQDEVTPPEDETQLPQYRQRQRWDIVGTATYNNNDVLRS